MSTQQADKTIFGTNSHAQQSLNNNGIKRSEWWLNINYAEVLEVHHAAVALNSQARYKRSSSRASAMRPATANSRRFAQPALQTVTSSQFQHLGSLATDFSLYSQVRPRSTLFAQ